MKANNLNLNNINKKPKRLKLLRLRYMLITLMLIILLSWFWLDRSLTIQAAAPTVTVSSNHLDSVLNHTSPRPQPNLPEDLAPPPPSISIIHKPGDLTVVLNFQGHAEILTNLKKAVVENEPDCSNASFSDVQNFKVLVTQSDLDAQKILCVQAQTSEGTTIEHQYALKPAVQTESDNNNSNNDNDSLSNNVSEENTLSNENSDNPKQVVIDSSFDAGFIIIGAVIAGAIIITIALLLYSKNQGPPKSKKKY